MATAAACVTVYTPTDLNVPGAEEKLPVEVALLDDVHVGDKDGTLGARPQAHQGKVLEHLTADRTSTNLDRGRQWRGEEWSGFVDG